MNVLGIFTHIRPQDIIDILLITIVVYHLYKWFRDTKAFKALVGLLVLGGVFMLAQTWGLFLTIWMFQFLWQVLIILLIILFQSEIRQLLEKVNPFQRLDWRKTARPVAWIQTFAEACFQLAQKKVGALIILERNDLVDEWTTGGIQLEGLPTSEIITSIFQKESPLHDGAVVVRKGRIVSATCYLPLSSKEGLSKKYGTRHRAGIGISERCDAWVIVVSEQRGEVSLVREGRIELIENPEKLSRILARFASPKKRKEQTKRDRIRTLLVHQWRLKLSTFALVTLGWFFLAGQQNFAVSFQVPVQVENLPANLEIVEPIKPKITLTARGLRKDASTLNARNVELKVDLTLASYGVRTFHLSRNNLTLPNQDVDIIKIEPDQLLFVFSDKKNASSRHRGGQ
jgi:uncharacterized protein (TIGR00159 family)